MSYFDLDMNMNMGFLPQFSSAPSFNSSTGLNSQNTIFPFQYMTSTDFGFVNPFGNMDFMLNMLQQQIFITAAFENSRKLASQMGKMVPLGAPAHRAKLTKLSAECDNKIGGISQRLNCNPDDLKAVIYAESGGDPKAVNPNGGATGLIQFMPSTARDLGTSTGSLAQMSSEQQLVYVEKYLQRAKGQAKFAPDHKLSSGELYALVFMPANAKKEVMCSAGSRAYSMNKGLDIHKDGQVTKSDLGAKLAQIKNSFAKFFS